MSFVLVAGLLAACGSSPHPKSTPSKRPTAGPPGAPGQKLTVGGTVGATMYEYRQPSVTGTSSPGPSGYTWGSADVEVCILPQAKGTVTVDWVTWALRYADNSVVEAATTVDNAFPQPLYPVKSHPVAAGQCVRGWVTFAVPADKKPTLVEYTPHGFVAQWRTGT